MKWLYLASLLVLAVALCQASSESSESDELQDITKTSKSDAFITEVKDFFQKKCLRVGGDDALKNFTQVIESLKVCLDEHLPKNANEFKDLKDSSSSEELCAGKRGIIRECFKDFAHVWQDCSEPEEKYLPDFVFDALDAVYDYICADGGAVIIKIFDDNTLECITTVIEAGDLTEVCGDKLKFVKDDTPDEIAITKAELCEDLIAAKTCAGDYIKKKCPHDSNFKDLIVGLYDAIRSPCTKDANNPLNLNLPSGH